MPAEIAGHVSGFVGLDTAARLHPHNIPANAINPKAKSAPQGGSGVGGYFGPQDIKTAYGLKNTTLTGAGQVLGLVEYDGYKASDVTSYEDYYGLPHVPMQNVLIDNYSGAAGQDAVEVVLDIELMAGMAPGVSKIMVYEAPNSSDAIVDVYDRIASDNQAKSVSISWGAWEDYFDLSTVQAENTAFEQLAAQGQSFYVASGDSGDRSYSGQDNNGNVVTSFGVDDPASQPFVTAVGGTSLYMNGAGVSYQTERAWGGSGGGISTIWLAPSYQKGLNSSGANASSVFRNVPDVALDADPNTGYTIYYSDPTYGTRWYLYGGTSCAAPVWAAFTALVNQQRASNGSGPLGFANPILYSAGEMRLAADYHDITSGSNGAYSAVAGLDNVTGWGSFNGAGLLQDLATAAQVTGRVALEGVTDLSAVSSGAPLGPFNISFRTPGTTSQVLGAMVTLTTAPGSANGTYSIGGVFPGTYDVNIKGPTDALRHRRQSDRSRRKYDRAGCPSRRGGCQWG